MNIRFTRVTILLFAFISFAAISANKENSTTEQGYEVHYNALSTSFLTPKVSKHYQIGRSKTKGFVNISVLKQVKDKVSQPVNADILISAENFYGQNKEVTLRKISENDGAIYYIGVFPVSSREIVKFKAQVKPENSDAIINIKFDQEFFTD
jgi:IMP cyclohydrolase